MTSKTKSVLMIKARTFMKATKKGATYVIYATPMPEPASKKVNILKQYKEYKDVFKKENTNMLPQH